MWNVVIVPSFVVEFNRMKFLEGVSRDLDIDLSWLLWSVAICITWGQWDSQIDEPILGSGDFDNDSKKFNTGYPWVKNA